METIKVLLVDDKEDYCSALVLAARKKNLQIVYSLDWENASQILEKDSRIEFVILDGKGKIEEDQEKEHDNFVLHAICEIDAWSNKWNKHMPFCVNTGFVDRFESLEGNAIIFEKTSKDQDAMFDYIRTEVESSEYRNLRLKFAEAFKAFDRGIVSSKYEYLLLEMIKSHNSEDYRKKNLTTQSDIIEACFVGLNDPIPFIPDELFDRRKNPIMEHCLKFLEGRRINRQEFQRPYDVPKAVQAAFRKVKESSSQYSHLSEEAVVRYPFLANFYLLMEILCWLPEFVDEHYEPYI